MTTTIATASICSARSSEAIGSRVLHDKEFTKAAVAAIEAFDFASARVPGQGFIPCPGAVPSVSAGVGRRSKDPSDYVLREHRGVVSAFLLRAFAAPATGCALVVYTKEAYLRDPDVTPEEASRVEHATHVLVAVLAFAGPKDPPLTPYRFVHNLAGGNREAMVWTADEIRAKVRACIDYDNEWVAVAD